MKLGKRLKQIEHMITESYTHIWDCCCDHGLLGASLLNKQVAQTIHFVDIAPTLIEKVQHNLQRFYPDPLPRWETHCLDAAALPLKNYEGTHLVIIAGVGGDLTTRFIDDIHRQHLGMNIDFLLCPVHHQFKLRQKLIELGFQFKHESLIEENQRFYEILLVSSTADKTAPISPVGELIWKADSIQHLKTVKKYLEKTLSHYERIQQGGIADVQPIIDAYKAVKL